MNNHDIYIDWELSGPNPYRPLLTRVITAALAAEGVTMWTIGVPLAFLGAVTFQLPVERVVLLVTAEEIVKCVVSLIRLRSNRWLHDVAGQMKSQPEGE